jgi:hypothetical protein
MIMGCGGKKEPTPDLFSPEKSILPLVIPRCRDEAAGSSEGIPKERLFRNRLSARVERGPLQFLEGLRSP